MMRHAKTLLASTWTFRTVRSALALAFAWAGAVKLADLKAFAVTIKAFAILPSDLAFPAAAVLATLEAAGGLLLLFGLPGGLPLVTGLLALFTAVVARAIGQGLAIDCGCFGPGDPEGAVYHGLWPTLWRDAAMLAGALYCLAWRLARPRSRPLPAVPPDFPTPNPFKEDACAR